MKVTYYGQNTLHIQVGTYNLLVDPFLSGNPLVKDKSLVDTLAADYILLTHAHEDHILDAEAMARRTGATIVSNYEIAMYYQAMELEVHPMNHGGCWQFDFGKVCYVNAVHTSAFPDGSYGGQPGGFIIEAYGKVIYIAGDTALTMDMKLIPLKHKLDLAILPIGDNFTMGYRDAVVASDFAACNRVLGVHYDTFGYIEINHDDAKEAFKKANKELLLLAIGESVQV